MPQAVVQDLSDHRFGWCWVRIQGAQPAFKLRPDLLTLSEGEVREQPLGDATELPVAGVGSELAVYPPSRWGISSEP
jgi:hypothetical protein